MISAFSIYAVSQENDTNEDRDETVPVGVKKINDMGVFTITCFFGIFAYVWIWLVLQDSLVSPTEAWLTFAFFFVLIYLAYAADRYNRQKQQEIESNKPLIEYAAVEIYRELINEKNGEAAKTKEDVEKREKMRAFIKETMKTDQIDRVNLEDLKKAIDGDNMISRIKYRRQVGTMMTGKREVIAKG